MNLAYKRFNTEGSFFSTSYGVKVEHCHGMFLLPRSSQQSEGYLIQKEIELSRATRQNHPIHLGEFLSYVLSPEAERL